MEPARIPAVQNPDDESDAAPEPLSDTEADAQAESETQRVDRAQETCRPEPAIAPDRADPGPARAIAG